MPRIMTAPLRGLLRTMIDDTGGTPVFTEDQLEDALDATRVYETQCPAKSTPEPVGFPDLRYKHYRTGHKWWDTAWSAYRVTGTNVDSSDFSSYDETTDYWELNVASQTDQFLYFTGNHYDLNRAAVDLLTKWIAKLKLNYPITTAQGSTGHTSNFTARHKQIIDLLLMYQAKIKPIKVDSERSDTEAY